MQHRSTVLVVDDDPIGRMAIESMLQQDHYRLVMATNGFQAFELATKLLPDLILLDIMMPGLDGYQVCRQLRAQPETINIPIVMITALDDQMSRIRGIEAGADDYISKPYNRLELSARVRTITRINRQQRLQTERSRFEWVVEHDTKGYVVINQSNTIVYANPQAKRYLGLPDQIPEDINFLHQATQRYHCEPAESWEEWYKSGRRHPPSELFLVQPESVGTQAFWLALDTHDLPHSMSGEMLLRLRNITADINYQRDIWKFHRLVTHKLRTPFIGMNNLELLGKYAEDMPPHEVRDFARAVSEGANRLRASIEEVLRFIDTQGVIQAEGTILLADIAPIIQQVGKELNISQPHITIPEALAELPIKFSSQALELTVRELLENAQKFHPSHTPSIEVSAEQIGGTVAISIADDGITLSPDQLSQVWQPYYQGEKYFTGEVTGMGLGLSVVAGMIWGVGGSCSFSNRNGQRGVVIELRIPLAARQAFIPR